MSVKHNKDGGGNAEIKKELQEVKKETQEVKTAGESTAALLALSFKAHIAQDRAAKNEHHFRRYDPAIGGGYRISGIRGRARL